MRRVDIQVLDCEAVFGRVLAFIEEALSNDVSCFVQNFAPYWAVSCELDSGIDSD
ncbi:MAG: hypothetical protein P8M07_01035 [Flavobacteriales bacterium]|nr:hypothetical protein [Flavobacteriales bacterium]